MRRRGLPAAARSRRSATTSSPTARRPSTASRCCRNCRSTRPDRGLAGDDEDAHARFIEGVVSLKRGVLRVACLYLPNGNPPDTDKYPYKLKWMSRLLEYSRERLKTEEPLVLAGDFNVIPAAADVYNPGRLGQRRAVPPGDPRGLPVPARPRPDRRAARRHRRAGPVHVLGLSGRRLAEELGHPDRPPAAVAAGQRPPDRRRHRQHVRAWEKPSDHVPVWADFDLETA